MTSSALVSPSLAALSLRDLEQRDEASIKRVFEASGFAYEFPDLSHPLFLTKKVICDADQAVMGVAIRLEGNAYAWLDRNWGTPRERWAAFRELHAAATREASAKGLDSLNCQLPPEIAKSFSRRLGTLGWGKVLWATYGLRI